MYSHPQWLKNGGRAAGVIVHLYNSIRLDEAPAEIVVDELPSSWYYPQLTTAYVLRPAPIAVVNTLEDSE